MRYRRGRVVEVGSLQEFDRRLAAGTTRLGGWRVSTVDLSDRGDALARRELAGATFLGCTFAPGVEAAIESRGAVVFPAIPESPVDAYRDRLYTPAELYDAARYPDSLDARAWAWSRHDSDRDALLARTLHDHAIDQALAGWLPGRRLVGVMGGHDRPRGGPGYADAARLARTLTRAGLTVATGGGPGAMEAANLGAWLASSPDPVLADALDELAGTPSFRPSVADWAAAGFAVRDRHPGGEESLGVPTWHYGHEPPNVFASAIAKYFGNAVREAVLLDVCDAGIVFLPGAAGTVQEVFQDACENYYADESSVAPMVLVGTTYWTQTLPAWPLLERLAADRAMAGHVHLVDTVDDATSLLAETSP